jgi:hypothetical protein
MARIITKELAEKIAKKLKAEMVKRKAQPHDLAVVYHNGVMVASFGIRRRSEKDKGHDHVPKEIFVGTAFARLLGQCPKSRDDWVRALQEKGIIPADPETEADG